MVSFLNKKTIVGVVFVVILVVFFGISKIGQDKNNNGNTASILQKNIIDANNKDSDGDGLKDWEEILWGTSPNKADTDEDGTSDGDEVSSGRNPVISAPDDDIDQDIMNKLKSDVASFSDNQENPTEILSQGLFFGLASLKNNNQLNRETVTNFSKNLLEELSTGVTKAKYGISDIDILTSNSNENIKKYREEIIKLMEDFANSKTKNELMIMAQALQTSSEEKLKELEDVSDIYQKTINQALKIDVPPNAEKNHLDLVNNMNLIIVSLNKIGFIFIDPFTAISGIKNYDDASEKLAQTLDKIASYLDNHNLEINF